MTIWYYLRTGPGALRPLQSNEMESFLHGRVAFPADENRLVHYLGIQVHEEQSAVLDLGRIWFARCRVRDDGTLDQRAMLDRANARQAALDRSAARAPGDTIVVDAVDEFEVRRLFNETRWEPTPEDILGLRTLVNERAGWNIL